MPSKFVVANLGNSGTVYGWRSFEDAEWRAEDG